MGGIINSKDKSGFVPQTVRLHDLNDSGGTMKRYTTFLLMICLAAQAFPVHAEEMTEPAETSEPAEERELSTEVLPETNNEETELIGTDQEEEPAEAETEEELPEQEAEIEEPEPIPSEESNIQDTEEESYFEITEEQLVRKQQMAEHQVLEMLSEKTEGTDYRADEITLIAESEEYARQAAIAYGGELISYSTHVAVIRLPEDGMNVYEAVETGMDPDSVLPAVDANWLIYLDEPADDEPEMIEQGSQLQSVQVPEKTDWEYWVDTLEEPDPLLRQVSYTTQETYCWQWYHEMIGTFEAWGVTTGSPEVKVAVIDSGVQENHEELSGKVVLRPVGNISTSPSNEHGTHVAGIIAGSLGNGAGGAGIAPDTTIYSYNVFRGNSAAAADIAEAVLLAAEDGAWIMNLSFGTVSYSQLVQDAVTEAYESGTTMFAAMGNYGTNVKCYPAAYDHVIGVAAVGRTGGRAPYSCYGDWCDISAPGSEISSSYYRYGSTSAYRTMNGTSMASPVAAGSAALYMSAYGYTAPDQMERIIKAGSSSVKGEMGAGIVSLKKLFGEKESAPLISFDSDTNILSITAVDPDDRAMIIYTLDGKKPAVRNKKVVCGDVYTGETDLSGMPYNTVLTVKAAVISGTGVISDISSLQIRTGGPVPSITDQKIEKISLINTRMTLGYSELNAGTAEVGVKEITLEDGSKVDLSKYGPDDYQWYSDNEQIASVDENGNVKAAGKGETYIWLKIRFQNTVKKAKCKVTVKRLSDSITMAGRSGILPGKTLQIKAVVLPKTANNRKTSWSIAEVSDPVYQSYASIDKNGLLSVKKGIPEGTVITVRAAAKDGSGVVGEYAVTVCHKVTSVKVLMNNEPVRSASAYAADLPETDQTDNVISLSAVLTTAVGEAETRPIWTSSQPKVAKVASDGTVTALKAGTTIITCKASDGSGKKAAVKVKVTMPSSGIFLTVPVKNVNIIDDTNSMVIGKTCTLTAVFGKVYGKPTVSTVKWSLEQAVLNGYDCLDLIKEMKLIKISKAGKITVSSKLLSKLDITSYSSGYITVRAETMDGTGHYDKRKIYLQEPIRSMTMSVLLSGGTEKIMTDETVAVSKNKTITLYADFDHKPQSLTIKSSDPAKCGPRLTGISRNSSGGYRAEIKITGGMTAGRSKVTITENGSGKKAVVNIRTKES